MNFINLKASLKENIKSAYFIYGGDVFLMYKAVELISSNCVKNYPEMNRVVFSSDNPYTVSDVVSAAGVLPFGDEKRLVVLKSSKLKATAENVRAITEYLKNPSQESCIIFFAADENEFFKAVKDHCESVVCDFLPENVLKQIVRNLVFESGVAILDEACENLIRLCGFDMSQITNEITKLCALAVETKEISNEMVLENVSKTLDFEVYELAENLARRKSEKALMILNKLLKNREDSAKIISSLYNQFARMLFGIINKDNALVAKELKTKEYAILKACESAGNFTPKRLMNICSSILEAEEAHKSGKKPADAAIYNLVFKIIEQ